MTSKTSFMKYFLIAFTLMFISSGLNAGTFGSDGKKKDRIFTVTKNIVEVYI